MEQSALRPSKHRFMEECAQLVDSDALTGAAHLSKMAYRSNSLTCTARHGRSLCLHSGLLEHSWIKTIQQQHLKPEVICRLVARLPEEASAWASRR